MKIHEGKIFISAKAGLGTLIENVDQQTTTKDVFAVEDKFLPSRSDEDAYYSVDLHNPEINEFAKIFIKDFNALFKSKPALKEKMGYDSNLDFITLYKTMFDLYKGNSAGNRFFVDVPNEDSEWLMSCFDSLGDKLVIKQSQNETCLPDNDETLKEVADKTIKPAPITCSSDYTEFDFDFTDGDALTDEEISALSSFVITVESLFGDEPLEALAQKSPGLLNLYIFAKTNADPAIIAEKTAPAEEIVNTTETKTASQQDESTPAFTAQPALNLEDPQSSIDAIHFYHYADAIKLEEALTESDLGWLYSENEITLEKVNTLISLITSDEKPSLFNPFPSTLGKKYSQEQKVKALEALEDLKKHFTTQAYNVKYHSKALDMDVSAFVDFNSEMDNVYACIELSSISKGNSTYTVDLSTDPLEIKTTVASDGFTLSEEEMSKLKTEALEIIKSINP